MIFRKCIHFRGGNCRQYLRFNQLLIVKFQYNKHRQSLILDIMIFICLYSTIFIFLCSSLFSFSQIRFISILKCNRRTCYPKLPSTSTFLIILIFYVIIAPILFKLFKVIFSNLPRNRNFFHIFPLLLVPVSIAVEF